MHQKSSDDERARMNSLEDHSVTNKASLYRVKMAGVFIAFLCCGFALKMSFGNPLVVLSTAMFVGVTPYFIRCEHCKSSIYYRAGGKRVILMGPSAVYFVFAKRCPCCGASRV
jgi:hypothetical protein